MRMGTILIVSALAFASACPQSADGSAPGGRTTVVANFYPVFEAAREVGGDRVTVTNLTPAGAEPHDLELSPKQVDQILDADLVLYMGKGFQPAVEDAVRDRTKGVSVDLLARLEPELRTLKEAGAISGGVDPHVWLDPILMARIVDAGRDALVEADPSGGATDRANAETYRASIEALDQEYRQGLQECQRKVIVTSHAAFGYLSARYGLVQEPIAGFSPEAEPDPNRLAELADLVKQEGVTTVFTEELVSPRVADTLAREAGVKTAVLNPLEGLKDDELARGQNYVSVMEQNLATLR